MHSLTTRCFVLIVSLSLTSKVIAVESDDRSREYALKTAYVFHFAELVQWPDPNLSSINLCLQDSNRLARYIGVLEGQTIGSAIVHVKTDYPKTIESCQMLLLSAFDELSVALQDQARVQHILLLSDQEDFVAHGGMLEFTRHDDKLNLVVNLKAVKQAGLKMSSKLLRMAKIVE